MKKFAIVTIVVIMSMLLLPIIPANTFEDEPNPEFEVSLATTLGLSFEYGGIQIYVKNVGDAPAHNVTLTDLQMDGLVVYNNRGMEWGPHYEESKILEPGEQVSGHPQTCIFGFGRFTVNMTISCDEGISSTGTGNGIILGFLIFVP